MNPTAVITWPFYLSRFHHNQRSFSALLFSLKPSQYTLTPVQFTLALSSPLSFELDFPDNKVYGSALFFFGFNGKLLNTSHLILMAASALALVTFGMGAGFFEGEFHGSLDEPKPFK